MNTRDPSAAMDLADLDAIRLTLEGQSVLDARRLHMTEAAQAQRFVAALGLDLSDPDDAAWVRHVRGRAITFLRDHLRFPVPGPIAEMTLPQLLLQASGSGHRRLCACTVLKVMHVIHHLEAQERLRALRIPVADVTSMAEERIYGSIGELLQQGLGFAKLSGGRKSFDSLSIKLLARREALAAHVYDRLRFRLVMDRPSDVMRAIMQLHRRLVPFNYVIPGQSSNTLLDFDQWCRTDPEVAPLLGGGALPVAPTAQPPSNAFSARSYRAVNFVADIPVRLPPSARTPGAADGAPTVFSLVEFQIVDAQSDAENQAGDASHGSYRRRQLDAIAARLTLGSDGAQGGGSTPGQSPGQSPGQPRGRGR